jgi:hypothetical protein
VTPKWTRRTVLGIVALVIVVALIGTDRALAQPASSAERSGVTLWIALAALLVSVAKVVLDLFVSPEDQALRQRATRHEERVEAAAGRVRPLLGLTGTILAARIDEAWQAGDAGRIAESAKALGDVAERAYHEMEAASDPLEIPIAVLMVECWELADTVPALAGVAPSDWKGSPAAGHRANVTDYLDQVQRRLHEIQDRGRRPD